MTKETELVIYDQNKFVEIFTEKTGDSFIEKLEKEVAEFQKNSDISSEEGRNAIKSYAYELSTYKKPLKDGKLQITGEAREAMKKLNAEENRLQDRIQELQDKVRQPLTDFEDKQKKHIEIRQERIQLMDSLMKSGQDWCESDLLNFLEEAKELYDFDWQEFQGKADNVYKAQVLAFNLRLDTFYKEEEEQAELEKLRKEKEARDQKDRDEEMKKQEREKTKRLEQEKADKLAKEVEDKRFKLEAEKKTADEQVIIVERKNQMMEIGLVSDPCRSGDFILPEAADQIRIYPSQFLTKDVEEWEKTLKFFSQEIEIKRKSLADEAAKKAKEQKEQANNRRNNVSIKY